MCFATPYRGAPGVLAGSGCDTIYWLCDHRSEVSDGMVTASKGNAFPSSSLNEGDEARRVTTLDDRNFSFGPFALFPGRRLLQRNGKTVRLGSRACEILVALVERAGELVDKNELMARVWPGISVVEGNLRTQMNELRRVLAEGGAGDSYIATIPGRGYRFVATVDQSTNADARVETERELHNLPIRLTRLIGRDDVVSAVIRRLQRHRFVTIVGSGGIGKTAVALAVACELARSYKDGAHFVDLAPISAPLQVASSVGSYWAWRSAQRILIPRLPPSCDADRCCW